MLGRVRALSSVLYQASSLTASGSSMCKFLLSNDSHDFVRQTFAYNYTDILSQHMLICVEAEVGVVVVIRLEQPSFSGGDGYINQTLPTGSDSTSHSVVARCCLFEVEKQV